MEFTLSEILASKNIGEMEKVMHNKLSIFCTTKNCRYSKFAMFNESNGKPIFGCTNDEAIDKCCCLKEKMNNKDYKTKIAEIEKLR